MGSHGRCGFVTLALGGVTEKVLADATVPVLLTTTAQDLLRGSREDSEIASNHSSTGRFFVSS